MNRQYTNDKLEIVYNPSKSGAIINELTLLCDQKVIDIPTEIEGLPVISLKDKFIQKTKFEYEIVKLPSSLKSIRSEAFSGAKQLKSIEIPASVEEIGNHAFKNCKSLESFTFEKGSHIKTIGSYVLDGASKLRELYLPEGLTTIDVFNIANTGNLKCYLPKSLDFGEVLLNKYHSYNDKLYIPFDQELINEIEKNVDCFFSGFYGEDGIVEKDGIVYQIFGNVAVIKEADRSKIKESLILPSTIAFKGKEITVKQIAPYVFDYLSIMYKSRLELKQLILPNSIEYIYHCAFAGFSVDSIVDIPNTIRLCGKDSLSFSSPGIYLPIIKNDYSFVFPTFLGSESIFVTNQEPIKYIFIKRNVTSAEDNIIDLTEKDNIFYGIEKKNIINIDNATFVIKGDKAAILAVNSEQYAIPREITYQNQNYCVNALLSKSLTKVKGNILVPSSIHCVFNSVFSIDSTVEYEDSTTLVCVGQRAFKKVSNKITLSDKLKYVLGPVIDTNDELDCSLDLSNLVYLADDGFAYLENKEFNFGKDIRYIGRSALPYSAETVTFDKEALPVLLGDFLYRTRSYGKTNLEGKYKDGGYYLGTNDDQCFALYQYDSIGRPIIDIPEGVTAILSDALKYCTNLVKLNLPNSLKILNTDLPFASLPNLKIKIPNNLKIISEDIYNRLSESEQKAINPDIKIISTRVATVYSEEVRWFDE